MNILGIESSCDETAAAVLKDDGTILSNLIASQEDIHSVYGGVVPELASRRHIEVIDKVVRCALEKSSLSWKDIDLLAVTQGPGLIGSLIIGISYIQAVSYKYNLPLVGVNHLEGHLISALIGQNNVSYPVLGLLVSGGHTMLVKMDDLHHYELIGQTLDDAAGEAFDKAAMMMGLGYPGGPIISKLAENGNPKAIRFPRGLIKKRSFDFSFSGLKTSVLYQLKSESHPISKSRQADIAASFQEAVVDILAKKTIKAAKQYGIKTITMGGGVTCNIQLRERIKSESEKNGFKLILPPVNLCTDNAVMIAALGYLQRDKSIFASKNYIEAKSNMPLVS